MILECQHLNTPWEWNSDTCCLEDLEDPMNK